ncbi:MAG TPA: SH3 domain-containing protein [Phototrophicaceae bacterium]|jgi:hypothetical protein|nr:SH3 domain-containing protein [Phototrophicaceae bacterium]
MMKPRQIRLKWLILLLAALATGSLSSAEQKTAQNQPLAAILTIQYPGVSVQLVDTSQWLPLPQDASAPLTSGDSIQTNENGRALLTFGGQFEILLMQNSTFMLTTYQQETDQDKTISFEATLNGHLIQHMFTRQTLIALPPLDYHLNAGNMVIDQPATQFAVWSDFEATPVITVADDTDGSAEVVVEDKTYDIKTGNAFLIHDDQPQVLTLDEPYSAARLIGDNFGCPGQVNAGKEVSLNVRVGPGRGYTIIGYILNGAPVRVVGITDTGDWYRVQKFTGFGWVEALSVINQCEDLPTYPRSTQEMNSQAFVVLPDELPLMFPFYGDPLDNLWFYRSVK